MKDRIFSISLLILAAITVWALIAEFPQKEYATPSADFSDAVRDTTASSAPVTSSAPQVSEEVIRLHILADSDSEADQAIKLAIRDVLLPYLNAATLDATTKEEALALLNEQCGVFTEVANTALERLCADYTATVELTSLYFPIRIYGSQTYLSEDAVIFPPGTYDSVQVILGSGNGHNWWCLAYPSLCFIDASYDYIPKDSELYKMKVGTVKQSSLEELFYGASCTELIPAEAAFTNSDTSEDGQVTVYFGSKLWELLKTIFTTS